MFRAKFISTAFCAVFFVFSFVSIVFGQDLDDVVISGEVVDSNNAIVVGATVTATFVDTGISRTTTTDANGRYRLIELAPGEYVLKVSQTGFADQSKTGLKTVSGQGVQIDFRLSPKGVTAEITVEVDGGTGPIIDRTRTVVGSTITAEEIIDLPNTANDVLDLVYTAAGTAEEPFSIRNLAGDDRIGDGRESDEPSEVLGAGNVSLAGGAANSTNITIDGLDNNDDREADFRIQPITDSVAEIQVITNQFSAEYGRASGGRINIRTKGGTRRFKGNAFLLFADDNLNANTYNNNRRGLSRLPFTEIESGLTLGGPIPFSYFKDKTYFFSSLSYRDRDATTQIFSAVPVVSNPVFPMPAPTDPGSARPDTDDPGAPEIANYRLQVGTPSNRWSFSQRIDHNFDDRHNLTFNYQLSRSDGFRQYRETTRFLEETLLGRIRDNDSFNVTDNFIFSPTIVNQARFQWSRLKPDFSTRNPLAPVVLLRIRDECAGAPDDPNDNCPDNVDIPADDRINGTVVAGNSTTRNASLRNETRWQFQDTLNFVIGDHNLRFGADIQNISSTINELGDSTGAYNFNFVSQFLANSPSRFRLNFGTQSKLENTYVGFFVQEDWRATESLSLALGLRYERETILDDTNNWGPRIGVAWSPIDDKSVFRFGAGVFYNRTLLRTVDDFLIDAQQARFDSAALNGPSNNNCPEDPTDPSDKCVFLRWIGSSFPNAPTEAEIRSAPGIMNIEDGFIFDDITRQLERDIKIPESYQFNVGFERDLGSGFAFETNFTFNKAVRLWREQNINAHIVPEGFADFTEYLLSLGDIEIPGTSSGTDIYRFELGDPTDPNGDRNANTGSDCNSSTPICIVNLNTTNGSRSTLEPVGIALRVLDATLDRPITNQFRQLEQVGPRGKSVYEGLSFEIRRRLRDLGYGFRSSFRFSYVLSRTRDDGFVDTSSAQRQGDFNGEFSRSGIDRRHRFRFSGTTELPNWLGGFRVSPLFRIESGRPFNVSIGGSDRNLDDVGTDRPNFSGDTGDIDWVGPNDPFPASLASRFSLSPIGSSGGNLGRNAGNGPALFIFDLNVSRQFRFGERFRLRPQISIDNVLNKTVFSFGSDFINLSQAGTPEFAQGFLVPSRTLRQRRMQFALRFEF